MNLNPATYLRAAWPEVLSRMSDGGSDSALEKEDLLENRGPEPTGEPLLRELTENVEAAVIDKFFSQAKAKLQVWNEMPQNPVTLMAKLDPRKEGVLRKILEEIDEDPADNAYLSFAAFGERLHFARLLILEGPDHPHVYDSSLVLLAEVDGRADDFLERMITGASAGVDKVFSACRDYPARSNRSPRTRLEFLQSHQILTQAYYINTVGRTSRQIQQEDRLYHQIQDFLNSPDCPREDSAQVIRQAVINFVESHPELSWALEPPERPDFVWQLKEKLRFAGLLAVGGGALVVGWPVALLWVVTLQFMEQGDQEDTHRPSLDRLNQLRAREDFSAHNQFSAVGHLKPGWVRRLTARGALPVLQFGLRHIFNRGNLAGVPLLGLDGVNTIHFARWVLIDNDRRLLFASNYDGSLESYMVDFVDKVAWGLNIVFSNGVGYPRTQWLVHEGARNEQRFKDFVGNHQIETQVWYAPYQHLTAVNIANNEAIREGLQGKMNAKQARAWLRRFG